MQAGRSRFAGIVLCMGWICLFAEFFARYPAALVAGFLGLYGVTLLLLHREVRAGRQISATVRLLSMPIAATAVFTAWAMLLGHIEPWRWLQGAPQWFRLGHLFVIGPFVACLVAVLFTAPLSWLYERFHWLPVAGATMAVLALQWDSLISPATQGLTRAVLWSELASLAIMVPVLIHFMPPRHRREA
jgi:hypothetical protein